jgi:hypothetical protein
VRTRIWARNERCRCPGCPRKSQQRIGTPATAERRTAVDSGARHCSRPRAHTRCPGRARFLYRRRCSLRLASPPAVIQFSQSAEREARADKPAQPRDWSRDIQARQEAIRRAYLGHADALERGDAADRRLARDIRRFVADMPVPLTRRQALSVELRSILDRRQGRAAPSVAPPGSEGSHAASPAHGREPRQSGPGSKPRR